MPPKHILDYAVFNPEAVNAMARAYEDACAALHLLDRKDDLALKQIVAKKIIEHTQQGERDPIRLRDIVLSELQGDS
jgi:hypothetical protein